MTNPNPQDKHDWRETSRDDGYGEPDRLLGTFCLLHDWEDETVLLDSSQLDDTDPKPTSTTDKQDDKVVLLDALYWMYVQYCSGGHDFMGAGETASEILEDAGYITVGGDGSIIKDNGDSQEQAMTPVPTPQASETSEQEDKCIDCGKSLPSKHPFTYCDLCWENHYPTPSPQPQSYSVEDEELYTCMRGHTAKPIVTNQGYNQCRECNKIRLRAYHGNGEPLPPLDTKREKNPNWRGDKGGYTTKHERIYAAKGKASKCENCATKNASRYEWANLSGEYKDDFSDWLELCPGCHKALDRTRKVWEALLESECIKAVSNSRKYQFSPTMNIDAQHASPEMIEKIDQMFQKLFEVTDTLKDGSKPNA